MPDQLGLSNSQQITKEDAANTALVGLLASKAAAKKFAKAKGGQQLRQANATLQTLGDVSVLENAQRKTLAGGTSAERKDMEKALRQRKRRRDRNFVRAKHACCRVALIDKGARIGEEIWGMCGVAVTLSQDFHVDHVTVSSGADGEWEPIEIAKPAAVEA